MISIANMTKNLWKDETIAARISFTVGRPLVDGSNAPDEIMDDLLEQTEREPAADRLRNRITLVTTSDEVKLYTHASVVCRLSEVLDKYYHDKSFNGSKYFKVKEGNGEDLRNVLRFVYLGACCVEDLSVGDLCQAIRVAHFLMIDSFKLVVDKKVKSYLKKSLSVRELSALLNVLELCKYEESFKLLDDSKFVKEDTDVK